jgi:hypothetical protein
MTVRSSFVMLVLGLAVALPGLARASSARVTYEPPVAGAPAAIDIDAGATVHSGGSIALVRLSNGRTVKLAERSTAMFRELADEAVEVRVSAGLAFVERPEGGVSSAGRNSVFVLRAAGAPSGERFEPLPADGDDDRVVARSAPAVDVEVD